MRKDYDVIVAGGGPSGCAAALSAARQGLKVLLAERGGCLGGMGTLGLVPSWCPVHKTLYSPLVLEIFEESLAALTIECENREEWVPIPHERLKAILDRKLADAGCDVLFFSTLFKVSGKAHARSVTVLAGDSEREFTAKLLIDCTGNAALIRAAGGELIKSERTQPATLCFLVSNVDETLYYSEPDLHSSNPHSAVYQMIDDPALPLIRYAHFCGKLTGQGVAAFNAGYLPDIETRDAFSVSRAMMTGRAMAAQYLEGLKKYNRAFANAELISTAPSLGVRESYRIKGEYTLTIEDYLARRKFKDAVAKNDYFIDVHSEALNAYYLKHRKSADGELFQNYAKGEYYEIPLRCLIPQNFSDILTAGRIISADEMVQGSIRTMPACLATGEAAGNEAVRRVTECK